MKTTHLILFSTILFSSTSLCQQQIDSVVAQSATATASISIQTDESGATVFIDGESVGVTPVVTELTIGIHHLRITPPNIASWLSEAIVESMNVHADSPRTLKYSFPRNVLVLSTPSGAAVVAGDSIIGTTPFVTRLEKPLTLRKQGYEEVPLDISKANNGILSSQLKEVWQSDSSDSIFHDSKAQKSPVSLYITGAATVLAGAVSAYFKVKADNTFSDYAQTGDPAKLKEVDRFDTGAGIALAATQIGLGLFTYFILSE
jgi:hypothetical protein